MSKLTKNKRLLLFWTVCVTARLLLVLFAKSINIVYLPILGILGIMGGIGFGVQYYRNAGGAFGQVVLMGFKRGILVSVLGGISFVRCMLYFT